MKRYITDQQLREHAEKAREYFEVGADGSVKGQYVAWDPIMIASLCEELLERRQADTVLAKFRTWRTVT